MVLMMIKETNSAENTRVIFNHFNPFDCTYNFVMQMNTVEIVTNIQVYMTILI